MQAKVAEQTEQGTVEAYVDLGSWKVQEPDLTALANRQGYIEARRVA